MNDEHLAGYIYEILSEKKESSLRDVCREVKNLQIKANPDQVQRCLSLLHAQDLVSNDKRDGVEMWALRSEADVQPGLNNQKAVSEREDRGARRKQSDDRGSSWEYSGQDRPSSGQTDRQDRRSIREPSRGEASGWNPHSNTYSNSHSTSGSYADATKSKTGLRGCTPPSIHTNTSQRTGADSGWPLPSAVSAKKDDAQTTLRHPVSRNGDLVARGSSTRAYSGDRSPTPSSQQSLRDSSSENTRSRNPSIVSMPSSAPSDSTYTNTTKSREAGPACPQPLPTGRELVIAKPENTVDTTCIIKSFRGMEISTTGDTRVAEYTSLRPEVQQYCNNFNKILQVLKKEGSPVKATEIAKRAGVGESKKSVNSALYFLEKKGIIKKSSTICPSWSLIPEECTDEDIKEFAIEHYSIKNPGANTSLAINSGSPDSRTSGKCKTCRGSCVNIENHTHKHYHQHYTQIGNVNILAQSDAGVENG